MRLLPCVRSMGAAVFIVLVAGCAARSAMPSVSEPCIISEHPGWPVLFELDKGHSCGLHLTHRGRVLSRDVTLLAVRTYWDPDRIIKGNTDRRTMRMAEIDVDVSGEKKTLYARPYQMPVVVNGVRFYVETIAPWAGGIAPVSGLKRQVRLSAVSEGESWGPDSMLFPVGRYRWRSGTYNNTWHALVPYNALYYHRGEDYGAVPDRLPVVAVLPGRVTASPVPHGDGRSNGIIVEVAPGISYRLAHMNIETVDPALTTGVEVRGGQTLARTGETWNGRKAQLSDPHLHWGIEIDGTPLGTFPLAVEAYFRTYPDPAIAVAGGYYFALPNDAVYLDATRSLARAGNRIAEYSWHLHDGSFRRDPVVAVTYSEPGLYSEELTVKTQGGYESRDFAQVRIYDPEYGGASAAGWFYHTPVRGIRAGTEVLFWNRLWGTSDAVTIEFGDGSPARPIDREIRHAYSAPGLYTARLMAADSAGHKLTVQLPVVVEH